MFESGRRPGTRAMYDKQVGFDSPAAPISGGLLYLVLNVSVSFESFGGD